MVAMKQGVVIYATGSPIVVDLEESLFRAGISPCVGVQNYPGESFLSGSALSIAHHAVPNNLKEWPFIVPLFTPGNRQQAVHEAEELGFHRPFSLIDPSVIAPRSLRYQPGLYVNAGCSLGAASEFGVFVFINRGAAIGHHAKLGDFVSIGPGIAGQVTVGKGTMIGAGAVVLPKITIGENAVIGAGAVVTQDVGDSTLMVGNPARVVKSAIPGYRGKLVK
jgi:sugar O-acyltransferase (sialic acid O-acetyltransferase NeuD family)